MDVTCRMFCPNDGPAVQSLLAELGYALERSAVETNVDTIQKRGGIVLVAESDGAVVGCVCVTMDARLAEGAYAEIVSLVVSTSVRGQGIGTALVRSAEQWAGQRADKIRVRANETRTEAHAFYEHHGFRLTKTQKVFIKSLRPES